MFEIIACNLFGAKQLAVPMPTYFKLNPYEQTSMKNFIKVQIHSLGNMHLKISPKKMGHFV